MTLAIKHFVESGKMWPAVLMASIATALAILLRTLSKEEIAENALAESLGTGARLARRFNKKDEAYRQALNAEKLYRYYFEAAPIGIIAITNEGIIENCNSMFASLVSKSASDCIGKSLDVFTPDAAALIATINEHEATEINLVNRIVEAYHGSKKLDNSHQHVVHFIDITASKQLEEQMVQSQKMQAVGQLAGGIAHDFNNLLTAILGFCDLLLQRHTSGDPSFADINHIHQNANRAAGLVRQLLAFSRQQKLNPQVLNITDILAELGHLLQRLLGEKITLNIQHARDLWAVKVDRTQLEQVIINLAVNARDAMMDNPKPGGELSVVTGKLTIIEPRSIGTDIMPAGSYATIQVKDTGTGIPADIIDRIFDPFFSTKDVGAGTGLGLATVYGILKQTGGYIDLESVMGEGTTFTVYLPKTDEEAKIIQTNTEQLQDLSGHGVILLVEDEDPVRLFGARALRNKGYEVLEARSGEAALELVKSQNPHIDLLVTDIMMPVVDGSTLIKILREKTPELKVVCISGYAEEAMREKLEEQSDIQFLAKPFTLKQLATTVKREMER